MRRNYGLLFMLLFVAFGALIVLTASAVTYKLEENNLQEEFMASASTVIGIKHQQFEQFFNRPARSLEFIAGSQEAVDYFKNRGNSQEIRQKLALLLHTNDDLLAVTLFRSSAVNGEQFRYDRVLHRLNVQPVSAPAGPPPDTLRVIPRISEENTAFDLDVPVMRGDSRLGFIRTTLDFEGVAALLESSPAGRIHLSDADGNFLVYRDRPLPPEEAKNLHRILPDIADDLLFTDLYVGEKMYAKSIALGEGSEFKLFLEMNDAILELKKEEIRRVALYLIAGVLLFSLPVAYMFSLVPKRLNEEIVSKNSELNELNATLNARVKMEVEANRQKDRIMFNQSKNAAMGEMIGMITHQWRQPLSSISALASKLKLMAQMNRAEPKAVEEEMDQIITSSVYLSQTIDDFKDFFKPDREKQEVSIPDLVDETLRFSAHPLAIHSIEIVAEIQDIRVSLYKNELIQVLMNLLKNSIDQLALLQIANPTITVTSYSRDGDLLIEVSDNGGGIDEAVLPHIFEEYFTAKEGGTGLGLYMSRMIIEQRFGGTVAAGNVTTSAGNGAKFTLTIPL